MLTHARVNHIVDPPTGEMLSGSIFWFNPEKGLGRVILDQYPGVNVYFTRDTLLAAGVVPETVTNDMLVRVRLKHRPEKGYSVDQLFVDHDED